MMLQSKRDKRRHRSASKIKKSKSKTRRHFYGIFNFNNDKCGSGRALEKKDKDSICISSCSFFEKTLPYACAHIGLIPSEKYEYIIEDNDEYGGVDHTYIRPRKAYCRKSEKECTEKEKKGKHAYEEEISKLKSTKWLKRKSRIVNGKKRYEIGTE